MFANIYGITQVFFISSYCSCPNSHNIYTEPKIRYNTWENTIGFYSYNQMRQHKHK